MNAPLPRAVLVAGALASACASTTEVVPSDAPQRGPARVDGRIVLEGPRPVPERWVMEAEMAALAGTDTFLDEALRVGEGGGLADCVVVLEPLDGPEPRVHSVAPGGALYEKVGPRYVPRVLAVPRGTRVTLRNRDSPCRGFRTFARRTQFNFMLAAGDEREFTLEHPGPVPMGCDLRPYMRGAIYVARTPWYAVTGPDGAFAIEDVPAGSYAVRMWHEVLGRVDDASPATLEVGPGARPVVRYALTLPSAPRARPGARR